MKKLRRFCDKWNGKRTWRVRYDKGGRTVLVSYGLACNLAAVFDGSVYWEETP
ncbi:MAG: hypothetical protein Q8R28_16890 [Dehalococcoidia bacterium]|nr:hypothetical protein [Dehalococcoidia bacterium]